MNEKFYKLPKLPYEYDALEPHISSHQLIIHHQKHHQNYVNEANDILEKIDRAHKESKSLDLKSVAKSLSFNVGGHVLHSLFWENLTPTDKFQEPEQNLKGQLEKNFNNMEKFKKEFSELAQKVEGSGWATLSYCSKTDRLLLMQIEKHNVNLYPLFSILLVLDVWEHAYYIDYENDRAKYIDSFWNILNWEIVARRLEDAQK